MKNLSTNNSYKNTRSKTVTIAAFFAALTCVGTMIIKIPTPTMGYVHPGDGFVLLSGLLLGPVWGAMAAGIGSALSDLIGGYLVYVPATFIIKFLSAVVVYFVYKTLSSPTKKGHELPALIISGIIAEAVMVVGYFVFAVFMLSVVNHTSLYAGYVAALAGILPNIIQGVTAVIISSLLHPLLRRLTIPVE